MSRTNNESIPLESMPSDAREQEHNNHDPEQDASSDSNDSNVNPRRRKSDRTRHCVLVGSAILQLPIWGKNELIRLIFLQSIVRLTQVRRPCYELRGLSRDFYEN